MTDARFLVSEDIRDMIRQEAASFASRAGSSGVTAWGKAYRVSKSHLSEFMAGKRAPTTDILDALGLEWRIVRKGARPIPALAIRQIVGREGAGDGWLPIESAPKDGTQIIAYPDRQIGGPGWSIASYREGWISNLPLPGSRKVEGWWERVFFMGPQPTHWRPLPPPPLAGIVDQEKGESNDG